MNSLRADLKLHPESRCDAVDSIAVEISQRVGRLHIRYLISGRIADLKIAETSAQRRQDGLWQQTCFEAFLKPAGKKAYCEFNFSPSTRWAAYRFDDYRSGMTPVDLDAPAIGRESSKGSFSLEAVLDDIGSATASLGLSTVIEETSGRKSYWALAHAPGKPDFHHPDCFVLQLPARNGA